MPPLSPTLASMTSSLPRLFRSMQLWAITAIIGATAEADCHNISTVTHNSYILSVPYQRGWDLQRMASTHP